MDELIEQFLIEGRELVQQASEDLMALERDPADAARLDGAFRAVHTLKGSVALFDFAPLGTALHAAEDLLGAVREGRLGADRTVIDGLLDCIDTTETWIAAIAASGGLPAGADAVGRRLADAMRASLATEAGIEPPTVPDASPDWLMPLLERNAALNGRILVAIRYLPSRDCFFLGDDPMALVRAIPDLAALEIRAREPLSTAQLDPFACLLAFEALSTASIQDVQRVFRLVADQVTIVEAGGAPDPATPAAEASQGAATARSLRVDATRIDALVDIVGELIVAKNGLAHLTRQVAALDPTLARALAANQADIERLVGTMHRAVMTVRMTPLAQTFRRFPRTVRDVAGRLGKEIRFEIRGEEVEADKTIVDRLFEPLLHLLRNAADHGIEAPALRAATDKPAEGLIVLEARRRGDQIEISVSDDGAGLDPARIRSTAKARGLMSEAVLATFDDAAVLDLIFAPGFSTAATVTDISGRGVGLDAVRAAVAALGGHVAVTSTLGRGSAARLTLPQAVSITTVMTVRVGDERFGLPIEAVVETARIPLDRILPVRGGEAFVLRDRTIPLVRLSVLLGLPGARRAGSTAKILVVAQGDQWVGVEVDGFAERIDVLLRPLTGLLSHMPGILGATMLGDGRILMVLDLAELIG